MLNGVSKMIFHRRGTPRNRAMISQKSPLSILGRDFLEKVVFILHHFGRSYIIKMMMTLDIAEQKMADEKLRNGQD